MRTITRMLRTSSSVLRWSACLVLVSAALAWLLTGANRGWTKTSVPRKTLDEVTGIEGIAYEKRLVPGIDFLAVALLCSAILAGASWVCRKKAT